MQAQCSIVKRSEIDLGDRIDAEYFQAKYLHTVEALTGCDAKPLRSYCETTGSAFYPAAQHLYEFGDLPFIRCVDCISFPLITTRQDALFEKIPTSFADEYRNVKRLSKGEIVITKVGTPCYASIVHDLDEVALSRTVLGLKSIRGIDPYYLVAFLRSKYGFIQLLRERELTIQLQLTLDRVNNVLIFKPKDVQLENLIAHCFSLYGDTNKHSALLYEEAQTLLLSELGLADWQPDHQAESVRNFSEVWGAGRMDAEYYQPKYDDIVNAVKACPGGWDALGNTVRLKDGNFKPDAASEYQYIELANITGNGEIADCTVGLGADLPSRARRKVSAGDVIVSSIEGSLDSIALIGKEYDGALCSTGFHVISSQAFNPETLLVLLKSAAGQLQLKKGCSGTILTAINKDELGKVVLPLVTDETQAEIQQKIAESTALRRQSRRLLESAKGAVEIAIERDEATAMAWLEGERADIFQ